MERNKDGLLPYEFEVTIKVTIEVENFNDDIVDRNKVIAAAKTAAKEELLRQALEAINDGTIS